MKNYFKVMSVNKNLNIFVFEDEDEVATREALLQADSVAKMYGGKIVVWALSGHVSRRAISFETPHESMFS